MTAHLRLVPPASAPRLPCDYCGAADVDAVPLYAAKDSLRACPECMALTPKERVVIYCGRLRRTVGAKLKR